MFVAPASTLFSTSSFTTEHRSTITWPDWIWWISHNVSDENACAVLTQTDISLTVFASMGFIVAIDDPALAKSRSFRGVGRTTCVKRRTSRDSTLLVYREHLVRVGTWYTYCVSEEQHTTCTIGLDCCNSSGKAATAAEDLKVRNQPRAPSSVARTRLR